MTSFSENVNLPHPNSKVTFGSLTIIPNKGESAIYIEEVPTELSTIVYVSKSRKFACANQRQIHPTMLDDGVQFENCCVMS